MTLKAQKFHKKKKKNLIFFAEKKMGEYFELFKKKSASNFTRFWKNKKKK